MLYLPVLCRLLTSHSPSFAVTSNLAQLSGQRMRSPAVRHNTFLKPYRIYLHTIPFKDRLLGYCPVTLVWQPTILFLFVTAWFCHQLPSDEFLTESPLPRLANRFDSARRGLSPPSFMPCTASQLRSASSKDFCLISCWPKRSILFILKTIQPKIKTKIFWNIVF